MTFTDDDLKRLHAEYDQMGSDKIDALIARLEAAEHAIAATVGEFEDSPSVQAWRKACGK